MKILVLGGTRFFGIHLVNELIKNHEVTIGTRGNTKDTFGDKVERIFLDRSDEKDLEKILKGKNFDIIFDNIAYCSNDIKFLLENIVPKRYILTSTMSVYENLHIDTCEEDFNPLNHKIIFGSKDSFSYAEGKRQAEAVLFQKYEHIPSVAVRLPYVIGIDDYTKRFQFYIEHIKKNIPMNINNINNYLSFINSMEAGKFISYLQSNNFVGPINAANGGKIKLVDILEYAEKKTGNKIILKNDSEEAPYNNTPSYSININKSKEIGFSFSEIGSWIYNLVDDILK